MISNFLIYFVVVDFSMVNDEIYLAIFDVLCPVGHEVFADFVPRICQIEAK